MRHSIYAITTALLLASSSAFAQGSGSSGDIGGSGATPSAATAAPGATTGMSQDATAKPKTIKSKKMKKSDKM